MTRPMTTEEFFEKINSLLKGKGKLPDILDYGHPTSNPVPIRTYEFALGNCLDYGANEGIYLDFWIEYLVRNDIGPLSALTKHCMKMKGLCTKWHHC